MLNLSILNENFTHGFSIGFINLVSFLSVTCGILVIISKNPIVSVLFLIGLFLNIAVYLMVLGISFIGLSYLLVYVGAVSILFLFILMLINVRVSELTTESNNSLPLSIIIILVFSASFSEKYIFSNSINNTNLDLLFSSINIFEYKSSFKSLGMLDNNPYFASSHTWDSTLAETSHISSIGNVLYTSYPMLLLITSIILLLSMVGAIIITLKQE